MTTHPPRVAFVVYEYVLGVSLMVVNSILSFAQQGVDVDVFINAKNLHHAPVQFEGPRIRLIVYPDDPAIPWRRWPRGIARRLGITAGPSDRLDPAARRFSAWLASRLDETRYDRIFAVECKSLIALRFVNGGHKLVYYSMELFEGTPGHPLYRFENVRLLKRLERQMIARADRVVVPSAARARMFAAINEVPEERLLLMPISSIGPPLVARTAFFRRRFGIPANETVVVYAGNIDPWSRIRDVIRSVPAWPARFTLVVHAWNGGVLKTPYGRGLVREAARWPVHFSTEYLDRRTLGEALASADLGLMFYEPIDANFTEIPLSSNKLSEYLRCGLPVVCSDFPSLRAFVGEHDVGLAIPEMAQLPDALRACAARLETLRENAVRCYETHFRFEPHFAALREGLGV